MKKNENLIKMIPLICTILIAGFANAQETNPCKTGGQTCYFGVEINSILCGYSVETYCNGMLDGKEIRYEYSDVTLKMSLLGADVDVGIQTMYAIDPATERAVKIEMSFKNNQTVVASTTNISGDTAYFTSSTSGVSKTIPVDRDVIFASQTRYPNLFTDFIMDGISEKKYKVYNPMNGEVAVKGYTKKSEEDIILCDSVFHTLVVEETDFSSGIKTLLWLNKSDGYNLRVLGEGRNIYLADKSVTSRIALADMDNVLFAKVGKVIPDFMNLSWLKVRAQINSFGENITAESLNRPGQKFSGSVTGNYIDGIFEIEPARYTGENAPPFPPDFRGSPGLKQYLEAELMIESDDPLIISEAFRITGGSKDSWEAAVRLSRWVAENIAGALPGGISAINTLKTQGAECGGHSRLLAAFCRAVGIPARLSIGCMYSTYYTGSFGQHAWTEVYMGDAGWIPVDATISETSYIDAGHIRLGESVTFRPVEMEILDYKIAGGQTAGIDLPVSGTFKAYTGSYTDMESLTVYDFRFNEGCLAADIPGQWLLALNEPDDQGRWFPKITRQMAFSFIKNNAGIVEKMILHRFATMKRVPLQDSLLKGTPEEYLKYTGNYSFAPARLSLDVLFPGGILTTQEPLGRSNERIGYTKKGDVWTDETGIYEIGFTTDSENEITGMILAVKTEFLRGEPVTEVIEPVIIDGGVQEGLKKYDEIKNSGDNGYLFSENVLNRLGYRLLNEERTDDAIKIFCKNVQEYPESFMANDALAETYLKTGQNTLALQYFLETVKLNPDYEYGKKMIEELKDK
ncbi:MAG: hypothetical protein AMS27_08735 [Bacteroides sp. SM23_62_1]|nr:MAG: hypothetical protein AMS27_08735 [Bacteroides sp. SM23_62_1]